MNDLDFALNTVVYIRRTSATIFAGHFLMSSKHRDISAGVANTNISAILKPRPGDTVDPLITSRFELHEVAVDDDQTAWVKATAAFSTFGIFCCC